MQQPAFTNYQIHSVTDADGSDGRPSVLFSVTEWQAIARRLHLSPRELEIAQGFLDCLDERGVACRIGISEHTVHTYTRRMYQKVGARSRCEFIIGVIHAYLQNNETVGHVA